MIDIKKSCPVASDGIHGLIGGVRGSEVKCGFCGALDEEQTLRAKNWWNNERH